MSISDDILTILGSYSGGYKRMREIARGQTWPGGRREKKEIKDTTFHTTLARLKKRGLVDNKDGIWKITERGRAVWEERRARENRAKGIRENRKKRKGLIVVFDVPEHERGKRDWLREELVLLGFEPIQKSVWYGPLPIPESFIRSLEEKETLGFIKFFKVREEDVV